MNDVNWDPLGERHAYDPPKFWLEEMDHLLRALELDPYWSRLLREELLLHELKEQATLGYVM